MGGGAAAAIVLVAGWSLWPASTTPVVGGGLPLIGLTALPFSASGPGKGTALQEAVNAGLNVNAQSADSFLTDRLQQTFEDMLLEATRSGDITDITRLKQKLAALVPTYFSASLATRALALLERYVDYRQAFGQLSAPTEPNDPSAMRSALQARQRIRQRHFAPEEYEALFGQDERLDQFTLARLEVERQTGSTDLQKRGALQTAEQALDPAQHAQRAEAVAHLGVQSQTAAFESAGASAPERFAQRNAQYGTEVATRLSQLDTDNLQWQNSLDQYAQARAGLGLGGSSSTTEQSQALVQLRQKLFTPEQQLRVEAGLLVRELGQTTQR